MPLHRDIAAEKAAAQLYKNAWAAGSNSTWMTPAFAAGLIFVGTGNPAPGWIVLVALMELPVPIILGHDHLLTSTIKEFGLPGHLVGQ
jgi:hypothetical protein